MPLNQLPKRRRIFAGSRGRPGGRSAVCCHRCQTLKRYSGHRSGHRPRKRFGQNFLRDEVVIERIAAVIAAQENQHIVEIGPGLGALTKQLLKSGAKLTAIELDKDLVPVLTADFAHLPNFSVVQADALKFDFAGLAEAEANTSAAADCSAVGDAQMPELRLVGNLPYNISTPLIFYLLSFSGRIADMHFMLQKEVVERLAASPGSKQYGRLSVMTQYYCRVEAVLNVSPEAFHPPPKVWSGIVRLTPYDALPCPCSNVSLLQTIVAKAFSMRRKTMRNALGGLLQADQLRALSIDPQSRPEMLSLEDYVRLANFVDALPVKDKNQFTQTAL